jgi:hypothetical protein
MNAFPRCWRLPKKRDLLGSQHVQERDPPESVLKRKTAAQPNKELSMLSTMAKEPKLSATFAFQSTFRNNWYSPKESQRVFNPPHHIKLPRDRHATTANLLFINTPTTTSAHNILPLRRISRLLQLIKQGLGFEYPSTHSKPCEYGKVYIGQTGSSVEPRTKQNLSHIRTTQTGEVCVGETW